MPNSENATINGCATGSTTPKMNAFTDQEGVTSVPQSMKRGRWVPKEKNKGGRPAEYPYQEWLTGGTIKLTYGIDFDIKPKSMRTLIQRYAQNHGIEIEMCWVDGDEVIVVPTTQELQAVRQRVSRRGL
jgi:hypothetical protein